MGNYIALSIPLVVALWCPLLRPRADSACSDSRSLGRCWHRGGDQIELEGGPYERTVLVEFNSMQEAKLCYESSDYQEALRHSLNSSNRHVVLVEGVN